MKTDLAKTIDEQDEIIKKQADIISRLSQALLQYITAEEIESICKG